MSCISEGGQLDFVENIWASSSQLLIAIELCRIIQLTLNLTSLIILRLFHLVLNNLFIQECRFGFYLLKCMLLLRNIAMITIKVDCTRMMSQLCFEFRRPCYFLRMVLSFGIMCVRGQILVSRSHQIFIKQKLILILSFNEKNDPIYEKRKLYLFFCFSFLLLHLWKFRFLNFRLKQFLMNTSLANQNNSITIQDIKTNTTTETTHQNIVIGPQNTSLMHPTSINPSQQLVSQIYQIIESDSSMEKSLSQKSTVKIQNSQSFKCKCKKTKCLKMYCECFALGKFCQDCLCSDCQNLVEYESQRAAAIDEALERDPDVFDPGAKQKKGGCICKKTNCLKKYCECYNSGIPCGQECKCLNCSNKGIDD